MDTIGQMWATMALTGRAIIASLGVLSVYSLAVIVERGVALRWSRQRSRAFAAQAATLGAAEAILARAEAPEYRGFVSLAGVVATGLRALEAESSEGASGDAVAEAVDEALGHGLDVANVNLRARLTSVATIAGAAPFLGLFGTVTGLISAFRGIADTGGGGLTAVSAGVSEALVTTVIGLFVAMPALWAYNYFMHRIDVMSLELDGHARDVVNRVVRGRVRLSGQRRHGAKRQRRSGVRKRVSAMPDITPIVNVALVLLLIFMIVTPMVREGIQVDTPEAGSVEPLAESDQSVVLAIREDGSLYVNLKPVDRFSLAGELALAYRGNEGKSVVVKGAENLPYRDILAVMDVCKGIGAPSVDLVAHKVQ